MQRVIIAVGVLAAACTDQASNLPTSPSTMAVPQTQSLNATQLPLRGSFTAADKSTIVGPTLSLLGVGAGNGTHLGHFTLQIAEVVNMATATGTGTFDLTAANGDQLFATTVGGEDQFTPPNFSHVRLVATIVGGTGRFAAATGTFILERTATINFAMGTSTSFGSFEGHIDLNN
jgi:hypothetical protein